jgi:hypothetical protein
LPSAFNTVVYDHMVAALDFTYDNAKKKWTTYFNDARKQWKREMIVSSATK